MATVRELRLRLGWSQSRLGVEADVGLGTVTDLEAGRPVRISTVKAIATALNTDVKSLDGITYFSAVQHAARIRAGKEAKARGEGKK